MNIVQKLENELIHIFAKASHLPKGLRRWLSTNMWWLVLITVIVYAIALVGVALEEPGPALFKAVTHMESASFVWSATIVLYIVFVLVVAIEIMLMTWALEPLRALRKRGWDLLLYIALLEIANNLVDLVLNFSSIKLLLVVVGAIVVMYVLFEIRGHFDSKHTSAKKIAK